VLLHALLSLSMHAMQCTNNGQKATLYLPLIMVDNAFLLRTGHLFPFYITVGCASAVQQWGLAEIQLACAELNWLQWNREMVALDPPSLILKKSRATSAGMAQPQPELNEWHSKSAAASGTDQETYRDVATYTHTHSHTLTHAI
jgi:hypothetical protein